MIALVFAALLAVSAPLLPWTTFSAMTKDVVSVAESVCPQGDTVVVLQARTADGRFWYLFTTSTRWVLARTTPGDGPVDSVWFGVVDSKASDVLVPSFHLSLAEALERYPSPCSWLVPGQA